MLIKATLKASVATQDKQLVMLKTKGSEWTINPKLLISALTQYMLCVSGHTKS